jgi:Flp pilus assembly pilin Flp
MKSQLKSVLADEHGQSTTEYALVILGAAFIGLLVVAWATSGGGAGQIGRLFNSVMDSVIGKVSG